MKNCKTCKYFKKHAKNDLFDGFCYPKKDNIGDCKRIPDLQEVCEYNDDLDYPNDTFLFKKRYENEKAITYDMESYSSGLYVTEDFGCVLHESE